MKHITYLAGAIALASLLLACSGAVSGTSDDPNLITVQTRDLQITLKEDAELQALRETVVRSQVEGNATIIYMAPEGSVVEQGTLLVKLDASGLEEKLATQKISVSKASAAREQAEKGLEILEKELNERAEAGHGAVVRIEEEHRDPGELRGAVGGVPEPGPASPGKARSGRCVPPMISA